MKIKRIFCPGATFNGLDRGFNGFVSEGLARPSLSGKKAWKFEYLSPINCYMHKLLCCLAFSLLTGFSDIEAKKPMGRDDLFRLASQTRAKMVCLIMTQQAPNSHGEMAHKVEALIYQSLK
jgi:hypothetical protein